MHHMFDEIPGEPRKNPIGPLESTALSAAPFRNHEYNPKIAPVEQHNKSQLKYVKEFYIS